MNLANIDNNDPQFTNIIVSEAAHSLKGFLMDKGERTSLRRLTTLEHKTRLVGQAMRNLSGEHARIAKAFGCNYLRLHFLHDERACTGIGRGNKRLDPRIVAFGLKDTYCLTWLSNVSLSKRSRGQIVSSKRLSPFSPDQQNFELLSQILREDAPDYYFAIAAVETLKVSLNSSFKALRNLTIDAMKVNYEAGLKQMPEFSSASFRASEQLLQGLDPTGEVAMTMRGLFS